MKSLRCREVAVKFLSSFPPKRSDTAEGITLQQLRAWASVSLTPEAVTLSQLRGLAKVPFVPGFSSVKWTH